MTIKYVLPGLLFLATILVSCTKEYDCADRPIDIAFIGFSPSDIDTFVIRKFTANSNFQNLADSFIIKEGDPSVYYKHSNDTTVVLIADYNSSLTAIKPAFDWQIFIPSKNITVQVSEIISEKRTVKRGYGIFSMDKVVECRNSIFAAKLNSQMINFSDSTDYYLYIRN